MARERRAPADIEVRAGAAAEELRFEERPDVEVRFPGAGTRDFGQETTRQNVDSPLQPAKTYRHVSAATRIWVRLLADEKVRPRH